MNNQSPRECGHDGSCYGFLNKKNISSVKSSATINQSCRAGKPKESAEKALELHRKI